MSLGPQPQSAHAHLLGQLHLYLLSDLLSLLISPPGEDIPVLQLLLAWSVPQLHCQQLLLAFPRQCSCETHQDEKQVLENWLHVAFSGWGQELESGA